jgi:AraC-like DNA-binding protein
LLAEYARRYPTPSENEVVLKNRILNYISKKYSEPTFSVKDIEEKFSMSTAALYRYFNKNFGVTPKKYINDLRIVKATYLLHKEDMTVKDAAISVGFKDPLYFSKVFKEKTGINPSEYYNYFIEKENKLI